jgi:hypothetical protein
MDQPHPLARPSLPHTASAVLEDLIDSFPAERISVGELVDRLDLRAHGVLLLILALPMCLPNVPGISTIFGALMLAPAIQLLLGQRRFWLPKQARAWSIPCASLVKAVRAALPALKRVEYLIRPRFETLTRFPATIMVGAQTLVMALVLILPMWGANLLPGIAVTLTALALLQRDGLVMLFSTVWAIGSLVWVYLFANITIDAARWLYDWVQPFFQPLFN